MKNLAQDQNTKHGKEGRERERGGEGRKGKGEGGAPSARRAQGPKTR